MVTCRCHVTAKYKLMVCLSGKVDRARGFGKTSNWATQQIPISGRKPSEMWGVAKRASKQKKRLETSMWITARTALIWGKSRFPQNYPRAFAKLPFPLQRWRGVSVDILIVSTDIIILCEAAWAVGVACENSRFSSLLAAGDVSQNGCFRRLLLVG